MHLLTRVRGRPAAPERRRSWLWARVSLGGHGAPSATRTLHRSGVVRIGLRRGGRAVESERSDPCRSPLLRRAGASRSGYCRFPGSRCEPATPGVCATAFCSSSRRMGRPAHGACAVALRPAISPRRSRTTKARIATVRSRESGSTACRQSPLSQSQCQAVRRGGLSRST